MRWPPAAAAAPAPPPAPRPPHQSVLRARRGLSSPRVGGALRLDVTPIYRSIPDGEGAASSRRHSHVTWSLMVSMHSGPIPRAPRLAPHPPFILPAVPKWAALLAASPSPLPQVYRFAVTVRRNGLTGGTLSHAQHDHHMLVMWQVEVRSLAGARSAQLERDRSSVFAAERSTKVTAAHCCGQAVTFERNGNELHSSAAMAPCTLVQPIARTPASTRQRSPTAEV